MSNESFFSKQLKKLRFYGKELWAFVRTWPFFKNFGAILALVIGLFFLAMQCTKCYTRHGESLRVPKITDKPLNEAKRLASSYNLDIVVSDSIFRTDKPSGVILEQNPEAGSRVKQGRTIYVTTTRRNADLVSLPDIKGKDDYQQYSRMLSVKQIKTQITERKFDPKLEEGTIMRVQYQGKDITSQLKTIKVPRGATLDFVVSQRTSSERKIPDLICMTYSEALFILQSAGLAEGAIQKDHGVLDVATAFVYRQEPASDAGLSLNPGDQVNLFLTVKKPVSCDAVIPDEEPEN